MTDPVREIKERIDVVDFIRSYLQLLPAGRNFKALCPFHKEKTPSFMVSPDRQSWRCFGCGEGGDVFTFLMKYENLEFYEALRVLAEKAGVELRHMAWTGEREFNILFDANAAAADYFREALAKTPAAREYLAKRGLAPKTIEEFGLGFAPDQNDGLLLWLRGKGIRPEDAARAGLVLRNERGLYFDRFRGRVMFPIANHIGRVVGFTGRILPEYEKPEIGKYINSPETPIFAKSRILYGFHKTKGDIRNASAALLVEGQLDFLMVWQDGVKNVAATSGTALTTEHLATLRRFADQLIVMFDTDEAGWAAAERAIDLSQALDFSVRVVTVPGFKDPADYVAAHPGTLSILVKSARHAMEFYFERFGIKEGSALQLEAKKKAVRNVLAKARTMASPVERMHWIKKLAEISDVSERALLEEMESLFEKAASAPHAEEAPAGAGSRTLTRRELIAERLLGLAVSRNALPELKDVERYLPPLYREAYRELVRGSPDESNAPPLVQELAGLIQLRAGLEPEEQRDELVRQLKKEYFKDRQHELSLKIAEAERAGNEARRDQLMQELASAAKEMHNL